MIKVIVRHVRSAILLQVDATALAGGMWLLLLITTTYKIIIKNKDTTQIVDYSPPAEFSSPD